jgi:uncharacterized membrane protein required for colicin V production
MLTDIIVVFALIVFIVLGFTRGFVRSAVLLVRIPMTIVISFLLASPIAAFFNLLGFSGLLARWIDTSPSNARLLSVAIVAVVIFIAIRIILHKLVKMSDKAKEKQHIFNKVDRWLGAVFGILRFTIIFTLIAIGFRLITIVPFLSSLHGIVFDGSRVALWLYNLVTGIIFTIAAGSALR